MCAELDNHWEVVSEAIQTILRKHGQSKAYEQLKEFTRGEAINRKILADYIFGNNQSQTNQAQTDSKCYTCKT